MAERQNIIHTDNLQKIRPLMWHGQEIYAKYEQIVSVLQARLGPEVVQLFARPVVPDQNGAREGGEAHWLASHVRTPVPLTSLAQSEQEAYTAQLSHALNQVLALGQELQQSEQAGERELGEVLQLAVEVPSLDYVLVENGHVVLVCWGFQVAEADERERFRLVKALDAGAPTPEAEAPAEPAPTELPPEPPSEDPPEEPSHRRRWKGVLGILAVVLLLGVLGWLLYLWLAPALVPDDPGFQPADPEQYGKYEGDPLEREIVLGQLLVVLAEGEKTREVLDQYAPEWRQKGVRVVGYRPEMGLVQVEIDGDLEEAREYLRDFSEVEDATVVRVDQVEQYDPSDAGLNKDQPSKKDWGYHATNAFQAWEMTRGDEEVLVAVIDSDFAPDHPELSEPRISGYDLASGKWEVGPTPDGPAHGTHVAGTATGAIDNEAGVAGVCPGCSALLIEAGGGVGRFSQTDVIEAMEMALEEGADVINLSLGLSVPSGVDPEEVKQATRANERIARRILARMEKEGVVVVTAAGNDGMIASVDPRNRVDESVVVAAVNPELAPTSFTNHGDTVDLGAPGLGIYSAVTDGYGFKPGTSMAAPFVTGAVGLIRSVNPELSPQAIRDLLVETARAANEDPDRPIGPVLDLAAAVEKAQRMPESPSPGAGCDCEELERRVDELERRLDELEEPDDSEPSDDRMVIPDDPDDLEFAAGIWRASEGLVRTRDEEPIELEFDIRASGNGSITFDEPGGTCTGSLNVELDGESLTMVQSEPANCPHTPNRGYSRHRFTCEAQADGLALCQGQQLANPDRELLRFFMEKQ